MITEKQNEASRASNPQKRVAKSVPGTEGECMVIPFRQTRSRELRECGELSRHTAPADSADEDLCAHMEEIPVVCVPWCAEAVRTPGRITSSAPHWLRSALLMAIATLYAATAVAVCLSLE